MVAAVPHDSSRHRLLTRTVASAASAYAMMRRRAACDLHDTGSTVAGAMT
jgi:hypothetical protein